MWEDGTKVLALPTSLSRLTRHDLSFRTHNSPGGPQPAVPDGAYACVRRRGDRPRYRQGRVGGSGWTFGFGQVDLAQPHRRARPPKLRRDLGGRREYRPRFGQTPGGAPAQAYRLRIPEFQPARLPLGPRKCRGAYDAWRVEQDRAQAEGAWPPRKDGP